MLKDEPTAAETPQAAPPALASDLIGKIQQQACTLLDKAGVIATITRVEANDAPAWPDTYRVTLDRDLDAEQRRAVQKQLRGTGVAGANWVFFKPTGMPTLSAPAAAPAVEVNAEDERVKPLLEEIRALNQQIQDLLAEREAQPVGQAQSFPSQPEHDFAVFDSPGRLNEHTRKGWEPVAYEFLEGSTPKDPFLGVVFIRQSPPVNGAGKAAATAVVDIPDAPAETGARATMIESSAPLISIFANFMRTHPLVGQVWMRGAGPVMDDIEARGNTLAMDYILDRMQAQRETLALLEGDEE